MFLYKVTDPTAFDVAKVEQEGRVLKLLEKPQKPP
ncbi:MAG: sugar phosphate nucleotidyltransferase [cyanobacterium endosymbiont of Rhopalodia yunnanensis]